MRVSFKDVYDLLIKKGMAEGIVSSRGTYYTVSAKICERGPRKGIPVILAHPINCASDYSNIYISEEEWGWEVNKSGARVGGIYNGDYSIEDWYYDNK